MWRIPCFNFILIAKLTRGERFLYLRGAANKGRMLLQLQRGGIFRRKEVRKKNEKAVIQEAVSSGTIDRRALLPELVS